MTKTQPGSRANLGITREHVVEAAFEVLQQAGIAKLSTRAIAAELGVSMNTVMWHIGSKDRLLELMAEQIMGEINLKNLRGDWRARATELLQRLRRAMLAHRDGASIVAGTFPVEPWTLVFADRMVAVLSDGCPTLKSAAWTCSSLFYFTLGLVQEEQAAPATYQDRLQASVTEGALPTLQLVLDDFIFIDYEKRFLFGAGQILHSAATMEAPSE